MIVSSKTWCEIGLRRVYFLWIFFVGWPVLHFITIKSFPVAICTNYLFLILLVDQRDFLLGSFYWFCGFLCHGFNGRLILNQTSFLKVAFKCHSDHILGNSHFQPLWAVNGVNWNIYEVFLDTWLSILSSYIFDLTFLKNYCSAIKESRKLRQELKKT